MIELVPLEDKDLELVMNWRVHPEVTKYMYTDPVLTLNDQQRWFKQVSEKGDRYFLISFEKEKVGLVSITDIKKTMGAFWAFYLAPNVPRGKGIGTQVEVKVIEYVFNELQLHKLRCEVFVSNDKVIRMHEKFGFRREAYYRDFVIKNGQAIDVVGLALLKSEWENGLRQTALARV